MRNVHTELPATDFAITSVDVPDRLDLREAHDRSTHDEEARRASLPAGLIREWLRRGLLALVVVGLGFLAFHEYASWRDGLSAASLARLLSIATGVPVTIAGSNLSLSPTPRLVLSGVVMDGDIRLDEVGLGL